MRRKTSRGQQRRGRRGLSLGFALTVGMLGGCEGILDVELPGQITEGSLYEPGQAAILVNSAIADVECAYSEFISTNAAGNEDVFLRVTGWWGGAHEFQTAPGIANCNTADNAFGWWTPLHKGRWQAERTYAALQGWEVPNKERLLAQSAIYAGVAYEMLGAHFCDVAVDKGPLMTPDQTLAEAERWLTLALGHVSAGGGDFALPAGISTSANRLALLLRSRVRYARGNMDGAAADARMIPQGYKGWVTREGGGERTRWNRIVNTHNGAGWNVVIGPIDWWRGTGNWPSVIPFTGYRDLAIQPDGRAVTATKHAITMTTAGAVRDTRVPVINANRLQNGFPVWHQQKYRTLDDDFPLANWEEAWLIVAEAEGGQRAIDRVNQIREAHSLPRVTYLSPGDAQGIADLIIEERRRSLFLEGRFWSTKILKDLWFPRGVGATQFPYSYQAGVRMVMPTQEFELNPNFDESRRGTSCGPTQRPAI